MLFWYFCTMVHGREKEVARWRSSLGVVLLAVTYRRKRLERAPRFVI